MPFASLIADLLLHHTIHAKMKAPRTKVHGAFSWIRCITVTTLLLATVTPLSTASVLAQQSPQDEETAPDERDLHFAFVTTLASDEDGNLSPSNKDLPDLSDGDLLSGADILKRLDSDTQDTSPAMLTNHNLAAYIRHPVSGKSFELQIGTCETLDFATGPLPFQQQVQCDDDLYAYRAGPHGVEILINDEIFFDIPLDEGNYRLNGVEVIFTKPTDNPSKAEDPKSLLE